MFRTRDLLVRQRTQTINALRGHMAEYGWVAVITSPAIPPASGGSCSVLLVLAGIVNQDPSVANNEQ